MWKDVPGFEGYYSVNEKGDIYSNRRSRFLKPSVDKYGYLKVTFTVHGMNFYKTVHRVVAETFIPNPDKKPCVNHKDENKLNNRVENLEWMTISENDNHGSRNIRMANTKCKKTCRTYL